MKKILDEVKNDNKGANLKRSKKIDKVVDLTACECQNCKFQFSKKFIKNLEKITRQVIEALFVIAGKIPSKFQVFSNKI
ncbi:MAG: hypothetical protein Q9M97_06050 [Candidatus Gracilibacteria bacterium]|nr:hypothetical protein [Candidatus Gracilibacteria bacterium]